MEKSTVTNKKYNWQKMRKPVVCKHAQTTTPRVRNLDREDQVKVHGNNKEKDAQMNEQELRAQHTQGASQFSMIGNKGCHHQ